MRTWSDMDAAPRASASQLRKADVPATPGVYAWYREGERQYVGKAVELRDRIWNDHLGQGKSLGKSALRRNVAEFLGFGSADDIKTRRVRLSEQKRLAVRAWIESCEVAWLEMATEDEAVSLEKALKMEYLPPLTKR